MENFLRLGGAIDITSRKKNAQDLKKGKGRGRLSVVPLPQNVEDTLAKVLPSEDILDRPEFDAREFINRNFPDEQSLEDIGPFVSRLRIRMKELDDGLSQASQDQSLAAHQALADLKEAKTAVKQLFHKIQDIRGKAEQSEIMVQEICRDIKQLDYAKRHLQTTLTALKRLQMLVNAVDQLELLASERNYREASSLLEAVNQLFTHFDGYGNITKIVELHKTIRTIQEELTNQIFDDFHSIGPLENLEENFTTKEEIQVVFEKLSAACAVVDALGGGNKTIRNKLIHHFCEEQLISYEKFFGKNGEFAGLEQIEKRYPWFYHHLLTKIEEQMENIFPKHWQMGRRMCIFFCEKTRAHIFSQIGTKSLEELDVTLLLKALQRTLLFEKDIAQRFEGISKNKNPEDQEEIEEIDENGQLIDPHSAEGIKRKHRRRKREAERKALEMEMEKNGELFGFSIDEQTNELPSLRGIISHSFDPYMTSYVQVERKNMEQMIHEVMNAEIVDRNGQLPVFSSSVDMFAYIRNSIKRCLALTNGQTFFDLQNEFKHCFHLYCQRLLMKLPASLVSTSINISTSTTTTGSTSTSTSTSSSSSSSSHHHHTNHFKLAEKQEEEICFVINTAEYCAETLPSLEEVIRSKIDKAYTDAIQLSEEIDLFHDVGATAMKSLVAGLENLLEEQLHLLHKINWQTFENVGDESTYVIEIGDKIKMFVPILRQMLSSLYFTNFCDKFAACFLPKILQTVMKCRKINQVATQQMLLDMYALKTLFLQLPLIVEGGIENTTTSSSNSTNTTSTSMIPAARYTKFVTQEMAKVESVLKLVGTPNEMLVESFKIMWPEGTSEDFQNIMSMKGLKKSEQGAFLDALGMQRKPTGKIAGMEEKMSDMTESLKKNMVNLTKVPFAFNSTS